MPRKGTIGVVFMLCSILPLGVFAAPPDANPRELLRAAGQDAAALGLTESDLSDLVVTDQYVSKKTGLTHVYLQQRYRGIPVHNAILNLNIDRNGQVLHVGNRFVPGLEKAVQDSVRALEPAAAVDAAASSLGLAPPEPLRLESARSADEVQFGGAGIAGEPIAVKLVYLPLQAGGVRLAWMVSIHTLDGQHYWNTFVDAGSGAILFQEDMVLKDSLFGIRGSAAGPAPKAAPAVSASAALRSGNYRVYPVPVESPSHAGDPSLDLRSLIADPSDPVASPLGWHDNGTTAYTITRGNNVHAYTDVDANGVPDPGSDPDGGAGLVFDFPFDPAMEPATYRPAAVTNLFYWNNIIHDITYQYGFDEASGNFQVDNFGGGGLGGDDVRAEAQDGSGTNNANFLTPTDGNRPRMQMFRWTAPVLVTVNPPSAIAGDYEARSAAFGPALTPAGTTGDVVLGLDPADGAGPSTTDACSPLTNAAAVAGKIALVDRGSCNFTVKVKNAQNAGAIAVIVANNAPGGPINMGGADATIVIPSAMISLDSGNLFKANLPLNATLKKNGLDRDSDFDNGVIVHEYAHGISNRLTGGPSTLCLSGQEQMGEGWSDYYALMLTDTNTDNRGIGTYVIFEPTSGGGIRPFPYSTDFGVNPATYGLIANPAISIPHGVGFVWATMLWDMTRDLVERDGFDPDLYAGSGGNNLSLQLVTDGLKIQPCAPGFVDGRDAILAADAAFTGGANQCLIWDAFAARGLGFSADQGSSASRSDGTEAFDLPISCCTFSVLAGKVNALKTAGVLNNGQANSLLQKLANAESALNRGQAHTAINILNAFINEVNAMINSGKLTAVQGQDLLDCAQGLIARIQEDNP